MLRPTTLPWRKPRHERLLLVLVAVAALTPVFVISTQDISHFCTTRAMESGHLVIESCAGNTIDIAQYNGYIYSNKAPGLAALAVPAAEITRLPPSSRWHFEEDRHLWAMRVLTNGIAFLVCAFLLGRVAEGIAAGTGALAVVGIALGTVTMPFAASGFDHVLTAAFGFGAFVLAWSRRPLLAGLCAGLSVAVEYEAAALLVLIGLYVL
ncbi:MAG: hypothetical protein JO103_02205, partial [Candidatus Eremiobacteraeota bacterium]|nr:hypothetical protein [Candidatus Eremiobacteraeota bacterium]